MSGTKKGMLSLLAPGPVAAAVTCFCVGFVGCAATGIAKFLRGRAFLPVAGCSSPVPVLFATCTGMQGVVISFRYIVG
jgi:hypothetical protein